MPKLGEYLQIKEAAEYLGVCRETLRNWETAPRFRDELQTIQLRPHDMDNVNPRNAHL